MALGPNQFDTIARQFPELGRDAASVLRRVEAMEKLLERGFVIPGIGVPIGLDSIIGLIPVVGDLIAAAMGGWILWEARNLGLSKFHLIRMAANIGIDTALGAVPLVGDAFDLVFRSNTKNLRILRRHIEKHHPHLRVLEG
jgi:Domain of unknown function (DUF4112)